MNFYTPQFNKSIRNNVDVEFSSISSFTQIADFTTNDTGLVNDMVFQETLDKLKSPYFFLVIFSDGTNKAVLPTSIDPPLTITSVIDRNKSVETAIDINSYSEDVINQIVNIAMTDIITFISKDNHDLLTNILYAGTQFVVIGKDLDVYTACKNCEGLVSTVDSRPNCDVFLDLLDKKASGGGVQSVTKVYVDNQDNTVKSYADDEIKKLSGTIDDKINAYGVKTLATIKDDITDVNSQIKQLGLKETSDLQLIDALQKAVANLDKEIASASSHTQTKGLATKQELTALRQHISDQLTTSINVLNSNLQTTNSTNFYKAESTPDGTGIRLTRNDGSTQDITLTQNISMERTVLTQSKQYTDSVKSILENKIRGIEFGKVKRSEFTDQAELEQRYNASYKYNYILAQQGNDTPNIKLPIGSIEGSILYVEVADGVTLTLNSADTSKVTFDGSTSDQVLDSNTRTTYLLNNSEDSYNWFIINTEDLEPEDPSSFKFMDENDNIKTMSGIKLGVGLDNQGVDNGFIKIGVDPEFSTKGLSETVYCELDTATTITKTSNFMFDHISNNSAGINIDKSTKFFTINESINKDPNITQSHAFISLQIDIEGEVLGNDKLVISLKDSANNIITDQNGDKAEVVIQNKTGTTIKPIVADIKGIFVVKGELKFSINFDIIASDVFGINVLDSLSGTSMLIQNLDDGLLINSFISKYEFDTNVVLKFIYSYFGILYDQVSLLSGINPNTNIKVDPNTLSDESLGVYIYSGENGCYVSYDSTGFRFMINKDDRTALFFPTYGYVEQKQSAINEIKNKQVSILGALDSPDNSFSIHILEYRGSNDWDNTKTIITGYNNNDNQGMRIRYAQDWFLLKRDDKQEGMKVKFDTIATVTDQAKAVAFLITPEDPFSVGDDTYIKVDSLLVQMLGGHNDWQYTERIRYAV